VLDQRPTGDPHARPGSIRWCGFDRELRNRRNGRQRLAAKAEAPDANELLRAGNLRRRVTGEREPRVVPIHATPVIGDAHEGAPALFDGDIDRGRPRIEGVLHQLLHHRRRTLDDLSGGDLVGDGTRQNVDARHPESYRARSTTRRGAVMLTNRLAGIQPARPSACWTRSHPS
jgi:hypothetical protein